MGGREGAGAGQRGRAVEGRPACSRLPAGLSDAFAPSLPLPALALESSGSWAKCFFSTYSTALTSWLVVRSICSGSDQVGQEQAAVSKRGWAGRLGGAGGKW